MPSGHFLDQIFELPGAIYPTFIQILKEADLRGTEFFTLSFIRSNKQQLDDEFVILRAELIDMLTTVLYETETGATGFVSKLRDKGYLRVQQITAAQKEQISGTRDGSKTAIFLQKEGLAKLSAFNEGLRARLARLAEEDLPAVGTLTTAFLRMLRWRKVGG